MNDETVVQKFTFIVSGLPYSKEEEEEEEEVGRTGVCPNTEERKREFYECVCVCVSKYVWGS